MTHRIYLIKRPSRLNAHVWGVALWVELKKSTANWIAGLFTSLAIADSE